MPLIPKRRLSNGTVVYYKATMAYICIMLTIVVLLLANQFGWL